MEQGRARPGISRRDFLTRTAGGAIVIGGLPAILAACTGAGNTNPATSSGGGGGGAGGPLRVGWSSEPDTMNPLTTYSTEANEVLQLVYDKLMEYDADLGIQPSLAESTSTANDGTVTYKLRSGVTWHDGKPFTAADVVFTFKLIHNRQLSEYAQWLTEMTSITAQGDDTVVVSFKRPQAFDPGLAIPILPEHVWREKTGDEIQKFSNDHPVGTGPFTFGEWKRGQTVTVNRNPDWWGTAPGADSVIWVLYQNEDVMAQAVRTAEVDVLSEVPPTIWDGITAVDGVKAVSLPGFSFHHIGINVSTNPKSGGNPLLLDRTVRQALAYSLDRNQLVQIALAGHGKPGSVLLPPAMSDYQLQIPEDQQFNANPDKANQMLDAAGYAMGSGNVRQSTDGSPLEFRLIAIESTTVDVRAAQIFRDSASKVGIKLDLQTMDENTLGSIVYNAAAPDWDIFVWGWDSGVNDPDYLLGVELTSQIDNNNDVYYSNPKYDALYDQQATELDRPTRVDLVHQAQQLFYDDGAYIVMWYQDKLQAYRTDKWTGWTDTPGGVIFNFTRANYLNVQPA